MKLNDIYFLNPKHLEIAQARYFLKDNDNTLKEKDIDEVFNRVVDYLYSNETKEHKTEALRLRREKKILDAGRPLAQAGTKIDNLLNCFVIGFEDDTREAISELKRKHFHIQTQGGGTGINFSKLRPKGSHCKTNQSISSGAIGFLGDFSYQSSNVSQGGNRSGANMGILEDWHPDLLEFITKKSRSNWENIRKFASINNEDAFAYFQWEQPYPWQMFNVSVFLSDNFINEVLTNSIKPWPLSWNGTEWPLWEFIKRSGPRTGQTYERILTVTAPDEELARYKAASDIPYFNAGDLELIKGPYHLTAAEWFDLICTNAWEDGCPGIIFKDLAKKYHNGEYFNPIEATNPCFHGDTLIATADGRGAVKIKELAKTGQDVPVYSLNKEGKVEIKWGRNPRVTRQNVEMVRVLLDDDTFLDVTPDHTFLLLDGETKEAKDLKPGDSLPRLTKAIERIDKNGKEYIRVNCDVYDSTKSKIFEHRLIAKFHNKEYWDSAYKENKTSGWIKGGLVVHHKNFDSLDNRPENLEIMTFKEHSAYHASLAMQGIDNPMYGKKHSKETKIKISESSLLRWKDPEFVERFKTNHTPAMQAASINISKARIEKYRKIQENEAKRVGLNTKTDSAGKLLVIKKCEQCTSEFEINWFNRATCFCSVKCFRNSPEGKKGAEKGKVAGIQALVNKQKITLSKQVKIFKKLQSDLKRQPMKKEWEKACAKEKVSYRIRHKEKIENPYILHSFRQLKELSEDNNHQVKEVIKLNDLHTVYNLTVEDNHTVGIVTSYNKDTGKASGIYTFQCGEQLLPRNSVCCLSSLVLVSFWKDETFDWNDFKIAIHQAIRGLDNIISVNKTGEDDIDINCLNERRIGLGTTSVAELLLLAKLKYSSNEGRAFVSKILEFLRDEAYRASIELAKEKGVYPAFDFAGYSRSEFFKTLPKDIQKNIEKFGIRNVTILTQAPTGTTGTMVGYAQGCEPYFAMCFTRNSRVGTFRDGSPAFIKWLDENNIEYTQFNYSLEELRKSYSVPEHFEEAHEISWLDHLKMQAVFAKYIDSSVSKTINLPNSATVEDVKSAYLQAYQMGIKSTTVYRDGSKQQILERIETKKIRPLNIQSTHAPKRSKTLPCDIHHLTIKGERWTVLVGLLDGRPFEIFCAPQRQFEINEKYKTGQIIKESKKYTLDTGDFKLKNLSEYLETDEHRVITRLISTCLRHGVSVEFLAGQLSKVDGTVVDFSKALLRVLRKYSDKEVEGSTNLTCTNCGSTKVVLSNGCPTCLDCNYSKCG